LSPGETAFILQDSDPRVYIYAQKAASIAEAALTSWKGRPAAVVAVPRRTGATAAAEASGAEPGTPASGDEPLKSTTYDEFLATGAGAPVDPLPEDFSTYEESTRLYTSGTTGMPKGVALPSIVEVMTAHAVMVHVPLGPQDRTLNMAPWFHRGGLYSGGPNPVFYAGGSVVAMPEFDPGTALDWVDEYEITFLIGAPATLEALANAQAAEPRQLTTLKGIVTMGAPLDKDAHCAISSC